MNSKKVFKLWSIIILLVILCIFLIFCGRSLFNSEEEFNKLSLNCPKNLSNCELYLISDSFSSYKVPQEVPKEISNNKTMLKELNQICSLGFNSLQDKSFNINMTNKGRFDSNCVMVYTLLSNIKN